MNDNKVFARQLDIVKPIELEFSIAIIGVGGVGSWIALALAKMGCRNIVVFDHDKVEDKNIPAQLYSLDQVGQPKVVALAKNVYLFSQTEILNHGLKFQDAYTNRRPEHEVIIVAVDSLDERRKIWDYVSKELPLKFELLIDVRMAKDLIRILAASPMSIYSINDYIRSLNPAIPPHEEPCTARSVVYNTLICGGLVANLVKKYAKKEEIKKEIIIDLKEIQIL